MKALNQDNFGPIADCLEILSCSELSDPETEMHRAAGYIEQAFGTVADARRALRNYFPEIETPEKWEDLRHAIVNAQQDLVEIEDAWPNTLLIDIDSWRLYDLIPCGTPGRKGLIGRPIDFDDDAARGIAAALAWGESATWIIAEYKDARALYMTWGEAVTWADNLMPKGWSFVSSATYEMRPNTLAS